MSTHNAEVQRTWWQIGAGGTGGIVSVIVKVEYRHKVTIIAEGTTRSCVSSGYTRDVYPSLNLDRYGNIYLNVASDNPNQSINYKLIEDIDLNVTDIYAPGTNQHGPEVLLYDSYEQATEDLFKSSLGWRRGHFETVKTTEKYSHGYGGEWYSGGVQFYNPNDVDESYNYVSGGKVVDFYLSGVADLVENSFTEVIKTDENVITWDNDANASDKFLYTGNVAPEDLVNTDERNHKPRRDDDDDWDDDKSKSDTNDSDDNPTQTALNCGGAMNNYVLTTNQLKGIFKWFWNGMIEDARSDNLLEYLTGVFGDMGQCITSVRMYPIAVPTGSASSLVLGRYDSTISLNTIGTDTNKIFECEYTVPRLKKNFLDFAPYNQLYLYLPYVGLKELDTNMYMGHKLKVKYFVDFTNGGLDVLVFRDGTNTEHFNGIIGADIPYSFDGGKGLKDIVIDSVVQTGVSSIGTVVGGAIGGGAGAIVGEGLTSTIGNATSGGTQNISMVHHTTTASNNNIFNMPRSVQLWQIRPESYKDSKYGATHGYVYKKSKKLSDVDGFTICENVKLKFGHTKNSDDVVINPSDDEQMILKQLLESGVYL